MGLAALLVMGWLAAIVSAYYVRHKPFDPAFALGIGRAALDVLLAAAIIAVAGGVGRRIVAAPHPDPLASLALQASLGLGICAVGALAAGLAGLYDPWVGWAAVAVLLILLRRSIRAWLAAWREIGAGLGRSGGFAKVLAGLSGIILVAGLAEALAPPVHFDALVYHLTLPREFLAAHSVAAAGWNPYWGMPLGTEMLFTWAMALGRPQTAAVVGWMVGLLALVGVLGLGRGLGRQAGWVGVAALLSGETLAASLAWAYADWSAALHGAALIIALDAWRRGPGWRSAALAGAMAGIAFGVKYSAGLGFVAGGVTMLLVLRERRVWKMLLAYGAAAALLAAPWLLKNLCFAGAPLYPFIGRSSWIDPLAQAFFRGDAGGGSLVHSLLTPLLASLQGVEGAPGFAASLGPLMIGLVPAVLLVRRSRAGAVASLGAFLLTGWVIWMAAARFSVQLSQSRLYYVLYPAWAVLAGAGYSGLARVRLRRVRLSRLAGALIVLAVTLSAVTSGLGLLRSGSLRVVAGLEAESDYLARRLGAFQPAMETVRLLGPGSDVITLWEPRGFYCRPVCRPDTWLDRWYLARRTLGAPNAILDTWAEEGVTHVLLYRSGMEFVRLGDRRYTAEDWAALDRMLEGLALVRRFGDGYDLYQVAR